MRLGMGSLVQLIDTLPFSQKTKLPTCSDITETGICPDSFFDAPRRGWDLWRFASLIPSGCRLPPIHKVMGDHASRGPTPAGALTKLG